MSTEVSRDKYNRLKQKAEKWQNLATDYRERIVDLEQSLKDMSADNNDNDVNRKLSEEIKELKSTHKEKIKELEDNHKDQTRELKYDYREKIAALSIEVRLKDGEIHNERRSSQDTIKYWKELYEEESRKNR